VPVDLRLIGAWRAVPLAVFLRVLVPVAAVGLVLAAVFGLLLFAANARDYVASGFFQAKMAMLALGVANALAFHALRRRHAPDDPGRDYSLAKAHRRHLACRLARRRRARPPDRLFLGRQQASMAAGFTMTAHTKYNASIFHRFVASLMRRRACRPPITETPARQPVSRKQGYDRI
jgi:hypothetical protein